MKTINCSLKVYVVIAILLSVLLLSSCTKEPKNINTPEMKCWVYDTVVKRYTPSRKYGRNFASIYDKHKNFLTNNVENKPTNFISEDKFYNILQETKNADALFGSFQRKGYKGTRDSFDRWLHSKADLYGQQGYEAESEFFGHSSWAINLKDSEKVACVSVIEWMLMQEEKSIKRYKVIYSIKDINSDKKIYALISLVEWKNGGYDKSLIECSYNIDNLLSNFSLSY